MPVVGEFNHGVVRQYGIVVPTLYEDNYISYTKHLFATFSPLLVTGKYGTIGEEGILLSNKYFFFFFFSAFVSNVTFCKIIVINYF